MSKTPKKTKLDVEVDLITARAELDAIKGTNCTGYCGSCIKCLRSRLDTANSHVAILRAALSRLDEYSIATADANSDQSSKSTYESACMIATEIELQASVAMRLSAPPDVLQHDEMLKTASNRTPKLETTLASIAKSKSRLDPDKRSPNTAASIPTIKCMTCLDTHKELIDCDGSAGYRTCTACQGANDED